MAAFVQAKLSTSSKLTAKVYQDLLDQMLIKFDKDPTNMKQGLETFITTGRHYIMADIFIHI